MKRPLYLFSILILSLLFQPKGGTIFYLLNIRWLYVFLISFFLVIVFVPLAIKIAKKFEIFDYPDKRKIHLFPIPRSGGLAIFLAFTISIVRNLQISQEILGLLIGGFLIFILGFLDDIKPLSATLRFIAQITASLVVISMGVVLTVLPKIPFEKFFEVIITIIWIIGISNAINMLDGVDGLAAGLVLLCSIFFLSITLPTEQKFVSYIATALAGCCAGFLIFNWHPAKIFLGDGGSTLIGYLIASVAVMGTWAENNPTVAISTPLIILSIPIFDMIYTTISRIKNKQVKTMRQWLEYVGKDHFHHRLINIGYRDWQSVIFILILNLILCLPVLVLRQTGSFGSTVLLIQTFLIFVIIISLMLIGRKF